jgi:hypothetical protein
MEPTPPIQHWAPATSHSPRPPRAKQQPHFASTFRITRGQAQRPPLCTPRMAPVPPRAPHLGRPCRGNHGGGGEGTAQGAHPPLPPTGVQAGGGGERGNGEEDSSSRCKSGLVKGWGLWREGGAGPGRGTGRGRFPEPRRCGAQGPESQPEGGMMGEARPGCGSRSSSVSGLWLGVALGLGEEEAGADSPSHWRCAGPGRVASGITGPAAVRPRGGASAAQLRLSLAFPLLPWPGSRPSAPPPDTTAFPLHVPSPSTPPRKPVPPRPGFPSLLHLGPDCGALG